MNFELVNLQNIIEGALLAAGKPLTVQQLQGLFVESDPVPERQQVVAALEAIEASLQGRGFELQQVASGYRLQVRAEFAPWISRLWEEKPQRYSRALLETLALIAYRQPLTRGEIEDVRGVAVSTNIIRTLLEREWVRVVGHREVPGKPALYATTKAFLDYFNLKSLDQLPSLADIQDLDDLRSQPDLGASNDAVDPAPSAIVDDAAQNKVGEGDTVSVESTDERDSGSEEHESSSDTQRSLPSNVIALPTH